MSRNADTRKPTKRTAPRERSPGVTAEERAAIKEHVRLTGTQPSANV